MNIYSNIHVIAWNAFASGSINKKKKEKKKRKEEKKKKSGTTEVQTVILVSVEET